MRDNEPIPLTMDEAFDKHIEICESEDYAEETIYAHRSRLGMFLGWLDENTSVAETADLNRRHLQDYRIHRKKSVNKVTLKSDMDTIRVFVRNMEDYEAIHPGLHEYVRSPSLEGDEGQRSDHLPFERGEQIQENLRKYHWASVEHVLFELLWNTGMRIGTAHSLDEDDFCEEEKAMRLRHRPESGTTLKNGEPGERTVGIADVVCDAISDYLENPERPDDPVDEYGRKPLFASPNGGRYHKNTLRNFVYAVTRPCVTEDGCPHEDYDAESCQAARNNNDACKCPSSKAPHALRSGALTRQIKNEVPKSLISDRADVSEDVLDDHYAELSEEEQMELRRDWFDEEYDRGSA
ncbi:tyrosine-type recombinase/integrase [Natronococcus roseus]|uniref:tyrosine-type recombinase/integrase n=1 Tax=Natronococcus roseus TaxID=1052014 RepID=UPI00374D05D6